MISFLLQVRLNEILKEYLFGGKPAQNLRGVRFWPAFNKHLTWTIALFWFLFLIFSVIVKRDLYHPMMEKWSNNSSLGVNMSLYENSRKFYKVNIKVSTFASCFLFPCTIPFRLFLKRAGNLSIWKGDGSYVLKKQFKGHSVPYFNIETIKYLWIKHFI